MFARPTCLSLSGATLTCGINPQGPKPLVKSTVLEESWKVFLCVLSSAVTWEEVEERLHGWRLRKSLSGCFSTGGMCLPALGCLTETQPGSVVSLVGPWVCVTTWCQLKGSFTRKSGCFELRTSTTGVSHTTGAYTNTQNH